MCQVSILRDTRRGYLHLQTVKSRKSTVSEIVHRLDPPLCRHDMMVIHSCEDREGGREGGI